MERFLELLGDHVGFTYTAWDRIVLKGYLDRLPRPENIIYFFREVVGTPAVVAFRAGYLLISVSRVRVPVPSLHFPSGSSTRFSPRAAGDSWFDRHVDRHSRPMPLGSAQAPPAA
ncbi:MAG TPA: hypothetical protein VIU62_08570, partial [Chloroflexota bacterium]